MRASRLANFRIPAYHHCPVARLACPHFRAALGRRAHPAKRYPRVRSCIHSGARIELSLPVSLRNVGRVQKGLPTRYPSGDPNCNRTGACPAPSPSRLSPQATFGSGTTNFVPEVCRSSLRNRHFRLRNIRRSSSASGYNEHDKYAGNGFDAEIGTLAASAISSFDSPRNALPRRRVLGGGDDA